MEQIQAVLMRPLFSVNGFSVTVGLVAVVVVAALIVWKLKNK